MEPLRAPEPESTPGIGAPSQDGEISELIYGSARCARPLASKGAKGRERGGNAEERSHEVDAVMVVARRT